MKFPKIKLPNLKEISKKSFEDAKKKLVNAVDGELGKFSREDTILKTGKESIIMLEYPFGTYSTPHIQFNVSKQQVTNSSFADLAKLNTRTDYKGSIFLPLPAAGIQDEVGVGYNVSEVGIVGEKLAKALNVGISSGSASAAFDSLKDTKITESLITKSVANVLNGVGSAVGINVNGALQQEAGVAINPNESVLFDRVAFRTFSLAYKFIPRNQKESQEIEDIIRVFKKYSLPSRAGKDSVFLGVPHRWDVKFSSQLKGLPEYGPCVLTSIQTVFNESKNIFHTDGYANEISLVLTFRETSIQTEEDF